MEKNWKPKRCTDCWRKGNEDTRKLKPPDNKVKERSLEERKQIKRNLKRWNHFLEGSRRELPFTASLQISSKYFLLSLNFTTLQLENLHASTVNLTPTVNWISWSFMGRKDWFQAHTTFCLCSLTLQKWIHQNLSCVQWDRRNF